jgi:hypothetical protein
MLLRNVKKILLLGCFFYLPFTSMAWGVLGHRIVGQVADSYLSLNAKKAIAKILGTESIAMASNWPDFIKSDTTFAYLSPWHYVNIKAGMTIAEVKDFLDKDTNVDAYTKINFLVKELKNKKLSAGNKAFYLKLLIHIVGDIHQPLHVGRIDDLGGNKIKLTWFGTPTNLHRVWDEQLINFQQLSYTEYTTAINHTTASQRKIWQKQGLKTWIYESYQSVEKIYADVKPDDKLDYLYNFKFVGLLNTQLLKGGVHLAGLLNEIFG